MSVCGHYRLGKMTDSNGLDEVQQLFLFFASGCHIALSGPPGVGKTTLVEELAEKIQHR